MINPVTKFNSLVKRTPWYRGKFVDVESKIFPDLRWSAKHIERNFDVVNLGSSSSFWGFDYDGLDISGMNWAQAPQLLQNDLRILENFHSILKPAGTVIVPLCFFSGLYIDDSLTDTLRYVNKLDYLLLSERFRDKARQLAKCPILFGRPAIYAALGYLKHMGRYSCEEDWRRTAIANSLSEQELTEDAARWIAGWKAQFSIGDLSAPLSSANEVAMAKQVEIFIKLIRFCKERSYKVACIIPPVSQYLGEYFTKTFRQYYIQRFLAESGYDGWFKDYSLDERFSDPELYFNSFFLNLRGRKMFTRQVLKDLGILHDGD